MTVRGVNAESVRRGNLSSILTQVHHVGSASRAYLTRTTGLNRSTIGALVGELAERGLVLEVEPRTAKTVGRPSPVVEPAPGVVGFAVNPELDAVTVGMVGLHGAVLARRRREVDGAVSAETAAVIAAELIDEIRSDSDGSHRIVGIGIAVPGLVRAGDGLVRWAPHLGWVDAPLTELLSRAAGLPAFAGNDATLGAIAERIFGAAKGVDDLIYLNGGASGIGGGVIVAGRPLIGVDGYAGEFGHNLVATGASTDPDADVLEGQVSRARLLAAWGRASCGPEELDAALRGGRHPGLTAELSRQRVALGIGLAQTINIFNPEMIVLGGFLASLLAADPGALEELVKRWALAAPAARVRIAEAELGSDLLLIGAAELAFGPLLADPTA